MDEEQLRALRSVFGDADLHGTPLSADVRTVGHGSPVVR